MKKILLLFVTAALTCGLQSVYAQSAFKNADAAVTEAGNIIQKFSECRDADVVSIGSTLINLAKPFVSEPEAKATLKMAKGLLVADLEDCSADIKSRFASQMRKFIDSLGDFKIMEARDDGDNVIVIGDENKISGMLVCSSEYEVVLIKLSAKPEELAELIQIANN